MSHFLGAHQEYFYFFSEMQEGVAVVGVAGQTEMDHLQDVSVCLREWSNF